MVERPPPAAGDDLVDLEVARRLAAEIDWTLPQLADFYRQGTERELTAIAEALREGDADEVGRRAHGAAGAGGTCGVHGVAEVLRRLETAANEGRLDDAADLLTVAQRRFARVMAVLDEACA